MNRKGFTLIELIATIALLAIIAVISFVSISKVIENNKNENCKALVSSIMAATEEYASDNRYNSTFTSRINSNNLNITANELVTNNYLNGELIDPYNKGIIRPSLVRITIYFNADYTVKEINVTLPIEKAYCGE